MNGWTAVERVSAYTFLHLRHLPVPTGHDGHARPMHGHADRQFVHDHGHECTTCADASRTLRGRIADDHRQQCVVCQSRSTVHERHEMCGQFKVGCIVCDQFTNALPSFRCITTRNGRSHCECAKDMRLVNNACIAQDMNMPSLMLPALPGQACNQDDVHCVGGSM